MSEFEARSISGSPKPEEERLILIAIENLIREEANRARPSAWKLHSRASGLRLAASELRHRLPSHWSLPNDLGWQSQGPSDLRGRGDAK